MKEQCYILQLYAPSAKSNNDNGCVNIFYVEESGEDTIFFGEPERATQYNTIGEAMQAAVALFNTTGVQFKAVRFNEI